MPSMETLWTDIVQSGDFRTKVSSKLKLQEHGFETISILNLIAFIHPNTSEYIRAIETAGHLGLENAKWFTEFYLRERNWGDLDRISVKEREEKYSHSMRERKIDPFYWKPPNGESIADLCQRIDRVINTLHRECDNKNVIIVCHGEVMWAFRVRLERMSQELFHTLDTSRDPIHRINNCQIIHYTRSNPEDETIFPAPYLLWMRSLCPQLQIFDSNWEPINRTHYSNQDLLKRALKVRRIIE